MTANVNIYKVLLIDDDEDDYIVTRDFLDESEQLSFKLNWVDNYTVIKLVILAWSKSRRLRQNN